MYRIGFLQFCPVRHDVAANIATIARLAAGVRADLLVLPELANSGYMFAAPADLRPCAEPGDGSGPFLTALRRLAAQTGGGGEGGGGRAGGPRGGAGGGGRAGGGRGGGGPRRPPAAAPPPPPPPPPPPAGL
jgi:uncharacterized membrane protein YgcG